MIHIIKKKEPNDFTTYRLEQNATYEDMPKEVKIHLKESLLEEQGGLCAYCMKEIDTFSMRIEHYCPKSKYPELQLTYSNLLAVCKGEGYISNKNSEKNCQPTCDNSKGDAELEINPLKEVCIKSISYKRDGEILSEEYQPDLDNILNLNGSLKRTREEAYKNFVIELKKAIISKRSGVKKKTKLLTDLHKSLKKSSPKNGYIGIKLWLIESWIEDRREKKLKNR